MVVTEERAPEREVWLEHRGTEVGGRWSRPSGVWLQSNPGPWVGPRDPSGSQEGRAGLGPVRGQHRQRGRATDAWGRPPARLAARGRWGRAAPWCAPPGSAATGRERKGGEEHLCEVSSPELLESRNGAWLRGMQVATEASHS